MMTSVGVRVPGDVYKINDLNGLPTKAPVSGESMDDKGSIGWESWKEEILQSGVRKPQYAPKITD